jgi:hypothetical protein
MTYGLPPRLGHLRHSEICTTEVTSAVLVLLLAGSVPSISLAPAMTSTRWWLLHGAASYTTVA